MMLRRNQQSGFTIVELLLALAFFSFIMLFAVAGFIQINRSYNKGLTVKQIHETGRIVLEDISRVIRTSPGADIRIVPATDANDVEVRRFCTGGVRFGWNEIRDEGANRQTFSDNSNVINLSRTTEGSCTADIASDAESYFDTPDSATDPNDSFGGIVVYDLNFRQENGAVHIELILASSDPNGDLLDLDSDPDLVQCQGSVLVGDEFCDTVRLVTTVSLRT